MAIGASPSNPDSLKPMFMAPEPELKRRRILSSQATTKFDDQEEIKDHEVDENQFFLQKIQELVNLKMTLVSQSSSSSVVDQEPKVVVIKDAKPTKKPSKERQLSRSRSPTDDADYDEREFKKQKKAKKMIPNKMYVRSPAVSNETTERLKKLVTEEMNCSELKLVIQKPLYASDLAKNQNRLNMPINQLETAKFLRPHEEPLLDGDGGWIAVPLLGPTLKFHENPMRLAKWHMKSTSNYILKTNWIEFVEANPKDLTLNTMVQVWSFRRDEQLCFALVCVGRAD
ncbi:hypothetical protein OSB04_017504 [Centaurea solstitialis]|uniref:B3 domain-containing protein n=1 Tax=Centaurea solstitialis TaxID=347529 RepID=A0AA38WKS4_9ASTR|nr:hypothetical protein OSB04_017504 [Centaurea solstitialis]